MSRDHAHGPKSLTAIRVAKREGPVAAVKESYRYLRGSAFGISTLYWSVAPHYYRRRVGTDVYVSNQPIDVFKRVLVRPEQIQSFTGRPYDRPETRWRQFGTTLAGHWDRQHTRPIPSGVSGPPAHPELYFADRFEDSLIHRSLDAHFAEGVPWEETEFVRAVTNIVRNGGTVWQDCTTINDVHDRCDRVDALYDSIQHRGMQSMVSMARRGDVLGSFPWAVANEILVDIGRDGALLFVNGRHRLSIARILKLDWIPVAIHVRHADWMDHREAQLERQEFDHPDLAEVRTP